MNSIRRESRLIWWLGSNPRLSQGLTSAEVCVFRCVHWLACLACLASQLSYQSVSRSLGARWKLVAVAVAVRGAPPCHGEVWPCHTLPWPEEAPPHHELLAPRSQPGERTGLRLVAVQDSLHDVRVDLVAQLWQSRDELFSGVHAGVAAGLAHRGAALQVK